MDLKTNSKLEAESMMNTIHFTQLSSRINYFPTLTFNKEMLYLLLLEIQGQDRIYKVFVSPHRF